MFQLQKKFLQAKSENKENELSPNRKSHKKRTDVIKTEDFVNYVREMVEQDRGRSMTSISSRARGQPHINHECCKRRPRM